MSRQQKFLGNALGRWPKRVTTTTVAQTVGLGRSTVGHVLAGRGDALGIAADTQAQVRAAAVRLGYRPNSSARAMRHGRFNAVGLLIPNTPGHRALPQGIAFGALTALAERGMRLTLAQFDPEALTHEEALPVLLREHSVDGVLLYYTGAMAPAVPEAIWRHGVPCVWLNRDHPHNSVYPDDRDAAAQASRHLLDLGHRRIVYLDDSMDVDAHYSVAARKEGYASVLCSAGLTTQFRHVPPTLLGPTVPKDLYDRLQAITECICQTPRATAALCESPDLAAAVLLAATALGLEVPRDLSIVTFSDWYATGSGRSVSVMAVSLTALTIHAVGMLDQLIRAPDRLLPSHTHAYRLLEGGTCAPPPGCRQARGSQRNVGETGGSRKSRLRG